MYMLAYVLKKNTGVFKLSYSSFPDVNGIYKKICIDGIDEENYDAIYENLVNTNQLQTTAKDGCGRLLGLYFNEKSYIITGYDGYRIVPVGGNGTNNWYYFCNINNAAEQEDADTWSYNISPGTTSDPQSSQDWAQHTFPKAEINGMSFNEIPWNAPWLWYVTGNHSWDDHPFNGNYNWYIKSGIFTYREKRWNVDGAPVEVIDDGENPMVEILTGYTHTYAKYNYDPRPNYFNGWEYDSEWNFWHIVEYNSWRRSTTR